MDMVCVSELEKLWCLVGEVVQQIQRILYTYSPALTPLHATMPPHPQIFSRSAQEKSQTWKRPLWIRQRHDSLGRHVAN